MNIKRLRILGSNYIGLFSIANDNLCFVPRNIDSDSTKIIEETLLVKVVKTSIYESSLLAVFAKMNNKYAYLPSFASPKEIEEVEKEIQVRIIDTEHALGNLIEVNDEFGVLSTLLREKEVAQISKGGLKIMQTNIGQINTVGSALLIANKGFAINPNASREEVKRIQDLLHVRGGAATANTGDGFIRNCVIANSKGMVVGEATTGHEINRIEEALEE